jgi:hypothetical protein
MADRSGLELENFEIRNADFTGLLNVSRKGKK